MTDTNTTTTPTGEGRVAKSTFQHDYALVDGSGSMATKWQDMMKALDAYMFSVRDQNINSHVTVQVFDDRDIQSIQRDHHINAWESVQGEGLRATWGYTPLYDAIVIMGMRLRELDPEKASIVIVTDGDANNNKFADLHQAKAILDWMRAKGWQITFIGAEFANAEQAKSLGGDAREAIGVQQKLLPDAMKALAKKRANYSSSGAPMHWSEEEQQQFGGYLAPPTTKKD